MARMEKLCIREMHSITTKSGNRLVRTDKVLSQVKVA